jgi:non-ribosomal peptide synthetase component F
MTFKQLLREVRDVLLGALDNQELPFGRVVRILKKENPDRNDIPPFQIMFIYQNRASQSREASGSTFASWDGRLRRADPDVALTTLDLIFELRETSTKLTGSVIYKRDVIDDGIVSEMITTFYKITEDFVCQANRCISEI